MMFILSKNTVIYTELVLYVLQRLGWLATLDPELAEAFKLLLAIGGQKDKFELVYATEDVKAYLANPLSSRRAVVCSALHSDGRQRTH